MRITNFEIDFIERTKNLVIEYNGEYKLTNLLNCLIGLIILPNERAQDDFPMVWDEEIKDLPIYPDLKILSFEPIQKIDRQSGKITYYPKTLKFFLKKLRNGIAHQNIKPINDGNLFVGVTISNRFQGIKDFEIEFRRKELQIFAIFIAEQYLHHIR